MASFAVFCVYHESALLSPMVVATRCAEFIEVLKHAAELLSCVPWNSTSAPTLFVNGQAYEAYDLHRRTDAQKIEFLLECIRKSESAQAQELFDANVDYAHQVEARRA